MSERERVDTAGLGEALGVNAGEALVQALVQSFWTAPMVGWSPPPMGPQGTPMGSPMPVYGQSPAAGVAARIFAEHGEELVAKVVERLDLDEVADKVTAKVVEDITRVRGRFDAPSSRAEHIEKLVREKIAEQLSARAVREYDARQAEMYEAWERDQQRQRERAALEAAEAAERDAPVRILDEGP